MDDPAGNDPAPAVLREGTQWEELGEFWVRVVAGVLRVPAFLLYIGLHYGIDYALRLVVPEAMANALTIARGAVFLVFLCVYFQLGIEILAVFMPGIRPKVLSFSIGQIKVEIGDGNNHQK